VFGLRLLFGVMYPTRVTAGRKPGLVS
jgi:hypothetical protein